MQYGSRAYWYFAQNKNGTVHSVNVFKSLEYTFSSFRKCRFLPTLVDPSSSTNHGKNISKCHFSLDSKDGSYIQDNGKVTNL